MLLRLAYLGVTNVFAMLRLLPTSDRSKDIEILALRHQLMVLQRQIGEQRPRFDPSDRALLAALLHQVPRDVLRGLRLLVRPDTVIRWHRDLVARKHAAVSRPKRPGRRRRVRSIRVVRSGVRMPRMNAVMERWVQTCRRELLDRTLIWNQHHLLHVLHEFETFYNTHRTKASPTPDRCARCPPRLPIPTRSTSCVSAEPTDSAASRTSTNTPPELRGWNFRQAQPQVLA
jgi:hypothetical protein